MRKSQTDPWLVLRTRSRHENTVASDLNQRRITAYLPLQRVVRGNRTRKIVLELPLFPGYVFVQPRADQYENLRYVRGSCGLILVAGKPAPMPPKDLDAVRTLAQSGAALATSTQLVPGQPVQVVDGPFMGLQGVLVRVKTVDRLVINAHLLSSSVSVEIDVNKVAAL